MPFNRIGVGVLDFRTRIPREGSVSSWAGNTKDVGRCRAWQRVAYSVSGSRPGMGPSFSDLSLFLDALPSAAAF